MVTKKCARCLKTVYPIEELKCLDKVWHKQCFKCQECGMTLSMNTYKGFERLPYCNAHVPQATYTTVLDTPEARRLAENSKLQSNIKYHEDYERTKGRVTQLSDDQDQLSLRDPSKLLNDLVHHGDASRPMLNGDSGSNGLDNFYEPMTPRATGPQPKLYELYGSSHLAMPKYQVDDNAFSFGPKFNAASLGDYEIYSPMGTLRRTKSCKAPSSNYGQNENQTALKQPLSPQPTYNQPQFSAQKMNQQEQRPQLGSQLSQSSREPQSPQLPFEDDKMPRPGQSQFAAALNALKRNAPPQSFGFGASPQPSPIPPHEEPKAAPVSMASPPQNNRYAQAVQEPSPLKMVQSQANVYDVPSNQATPVGQQPFKFQGFQRPAQTQQQPMYQSPSLIKQQQQQQQYQQVQQQQQPHYQNSFMAGHRPQQQQQSQHQQQQQRPQMQQQQSYSQPPASPQQSISATKFRPSPQHGRCYVALYDYMAGDIDEVTFCEGDVIVNGEPIEGGWMIGTVLRNGQRGMLPSNYVESAA